MLYSNQDSTGVATKVIAIDTNNKTITLEKTLSTSSAVNAKMYFQTSANIASGIGSHSEGCGTLASGKGSHAEGGLTQATKDWSHAEGAQTKATGINSHAEGWKTTASTFEAHAEGAHTTASGYQSHAEGRYSKAIGEISHAEGSWTKATGYASHAEGYNTHATTSYQHVQGKYNKTVDEVAFIVGNGTASTPSNAHVLDWNGNAYYAGNVYAGSAVPGSTKAKKLATESQVQDVEDKIGSSTDGATATTVYGAIAGLKGTEKDDYVNTLTLHGLNNRTRAMMGLPSGTTPQSTHTIYNALSVATQAQGEAANAVSIASAALSKTDGGIVQGPLTAQGGLQTKGILLTQGADYGASLPTGSVGSGRLFFQPDDSIIDFSDAEANADITFGRVIKIGGVPILMQLQFTVTTQSKVHISFPTTAVMLSDQKILDIYGNNELSLFEFGGDNHIESSYILDPGSYTYNFPIY